MRGIRNDPERREVRLLQRHVPFANARVLDIGCGDGRLTRRLSGFAESIVAMDLTHDEVATALRKTPKRYGPTTRFTVASGERLPFSDGCFGVVLFSWSL